MLNLKFGMTRQTKFSKDLMIISTILSLEQEVEIMQVLSAWVKINKKQIINIFLLKTD